MSEFRRSPIGSRIVGGVFGFIFCGIGITVLIFLWSEPFGQFGSPPIFFRIFGSFIALAFVVMGGAVAIACIVGGHSRTGMFDNRAGAAPALRIGGYTCPHCGASLGEKADVSPLGDVKCTFCGSWFNVHRPAEEQNI
jgi:hypothetical protein